MSRSRPQPVRHGQLHSPSGTSMTTALMMTMHDYSDNHENGENDDVDGDDGKDDMTTMI